VTAHELIARGLFAAVAFAPASTAQEAVALAQRIDSVTVYSDSARVTRTSEPVASDGTYRFTDLPASTDRDNVRVRLSSGRVLGVEVTERWVEQVPEERVQRLRDELLVLQRLQQARSEDLALLAELREYLETQLAAPELDQEEVPLPSLEAWQAGNDYYSGALGELLRERRELLREQREAGVRIGALQAQLGELASDRPVKLFDVSVEVDVDDQPAIATLEYFVSGCGWTPTYDLRTAGDAREVQLIHRAEVRQQSGEDWRGVELALSTARPRRGATGPEPQRRWVDLSRWGAGSRRLESSRRGLQLDTRAVSQEALRFENKDMPAEAPEPYASPEASGLSVRFLLPSRETLASRPEPTTVLVGESTLEVEPELYCAPALEETVWLRGRAKNTTPFVLLPGPAAVFFGEDFIGNASLGEVQPGQELELALGAVPGVTAERVLVAEEHDPPGFLSSTAEEISRWRVRLTNHGSPVEEADGSVRVVVREAIPRSRDERLVVKVSKMSHQPSQAERWRTDQADRGIWTWVVPVKAGGEADLTWQVTFAHPNSMPVESD
jgi:uncharacterized protein (TIGR02231 family)